MGDPMKKRVLGVVGSPRKKGNTHILVSRILEGAEVEGAESDILFLGKLKIRECNGCHACWEGKSCSRKDGMNDVYPRIAESGAIVLGTPVYWYAPTALMKAFIDRFVYFNCPENRPQVRGKPAAIAIPCEEESPETAELVVAFFERSLKYLEMSLVGKVVAPGVGGKGDVLKKEECLEAAYELGRKLVKCDA
jgi:multimeric flavodoxin WrbA